MSFSIRDHPFYERMRQRSPAEVVGEVIGDDAIEAVDDDTRKQAFRRVAKDIMFGRTERTKYGFPSDTNGEVARAMEWAFKAGRRAEADRMSNRQKG